AAPQHADLRCRRRLLGEPHVLPHPVRTAPERAQLAHVLPGPLSDEAGAVDADLDAHLLDPGVALLVELAALDRVDLPRERVEARPVALRDEQLQLVVRGALGDGALDQLDLVARERLLGGRRGQLRGRGGRRQLWARTASRSRHLLLLPEGWPWAVAWVHPRGARRAGW